MPTALLLQARTSVRLTHSSPYRAENLACDLHKSNQHVLQLEKQEVIEDKAGSHSSHFSLFIYHGVGITPAVA